MVKKIIMKKKIKGLYFLISSVVIGLLHLPFAFAKAATGNKLFYHPPVDSAKKNNGWFEAIYSGFEIRIRQSAFKPERIEPAGIWLRQRGYWYLDPGRKIAE